MPTRLDIRSPRHVRADSEVHGADGPFPIQRLPISDRSKWGPVDAAFYDAAVSMGWAEVPDHNSFDR